MGEEEKEEEEEGRENIGSHWATEMTNSAEQELERLWAQTG